jgi:trans-aconitate methyltransferase
MARGDRQTPTQHWDPERYQRNAGFVAVLGEPVLELLAPKRGERILDLGCGDGTLTQKLAVAGASVIAVDQSAEQVAAARARGLDARVADGAHLTFEREFDAVFSNAALHWMRDADAVIAGVHRALRPGGRFVAEMGGAGNVAKVLAAAVAALERRGIDGRSAVPWYFPSPSEYRAKLERRGFRLRTIELFPRPTPLPGEIGAWLETFGEAFLDRLPPAERPAYLAEVAAALAPALRGPDGWTVDYVRLRFAAEKPA